MISRSQKPILTKLAAIFLAVGLVQGCSLLSTKPDSDPSLGAFKMVSAQPLPVEIVTDISQIDNPNPNPMAIPAQGDWQQQGAVPAPGQQIAPEEPPAMAQRAPAVHRRRGPRTGKVETYIVKPGDTLMKISFEKFGDVYRWREIYDDNKNKISNYNALVKGTVLKIQGVEYVVIDKNGKPYLIKKRDTLVKIAKNVYNDYRGWKKIWHNNPQLIRDPNKIYAGFTLYYVPVNHQVPVPVVEVNKALPKAAEPAPSQEREPSAEK